MKKINLFYENKSLALEMIAEMNKSYTALGTLPKSQILRTPSDNSHYELVVNNHKEK